jgi:hypothetical protein
MMSPRTFGLCEGSSTLVRGASASARHFAPEGREHIQFDNFANLAEALNPRPPCTKQTGQTGAAFSRGTAAPFLSRLHVYHVAHLSLYLRSFSQFVAENENYTGAFQIDGKIFQTTGA